MTMKNISRYYFWIAVILIPSVCRSQESKNAVYLEVLGPGILYSVNYERFISDRFTGRIGASVFSLDANGGREQSTIYMLPVMANYLLGSGNSKFEIGAGSSVITIREKNYGDLHPTRFANVTTSSGFLLVGSLGYRYQPSDGGLHFRIVASPILSPYTGYFFPSAGLSFGICF